jgi:hypothetical protein
LGRRPGPVEDGASTEGRPYNLPIKKIIDDYGG